jgi:glucosamine--fructose-6-phosphate aminotransferase (isomerizing)
MIETLHSNAYVADILNQPDAVQALLASLQQIDPGKFRPFADGLRSGALKRIVLTGMGASYHAFHPLWLRLINQGLEVQLIETSELIHHLPQLIDSETLIVAASQSGRSAEILHLLEKTRGGVPLIGITNEPGSPLAQGSSAVMFLEAGAEHSVSCKTYTNTLVALAVLGDLLSGQDPSQTLADLGDLPAHLAGYLANWQSFIEEGLSAVEGVRYLVLAGRGPSLAAALTGGLIMKEAAHFPTEGMSCAAFRHGPMEMVSSGVFVVVYEGVGTTQSLNAALAADIQKAGGRSRLVGAGSIAGLFSLPVAPEVCRPALEILPAQMVSLVFAVQCGHNPGYFERGSKVTEAE